MICGENYHALQLLAYTHAGKVDVIYIDPPYNTGDKSWKYNNRFVDRNDSYRHSKWLAMMERRLKLAKRLLKPTGILIVTIDENEVHHLGALLEMLLPASKRQMVTIVINPKGVYQTGFARVEEYALFAMPSDINQPIVAQRTDFLRDQQLELGRSDPWISLLKRGSGSRPSESPNLCYPIVLDSLFRVIGSGPSLRDRVKAGELSESDQDGWLPTDRARPDQHQLWPFRSNGSLGRWLVSASSLMDLYSRGQARVSRFDPVTGRGVVHYLSKKQRERLAVGELQEIGRQDDGSLILEEVAAPKKTPVTVWHRKAHDAGTHGSTLLAKFLGRGRSFEFPKSIYSTADTLRTVVSENPDAVVLDFFAGSGTTLHSLALLNAQDGGRRKCILVTNNDVSDSAAKALNGNGCFAGDAEYEEHGIFEAVTMPRVEAAVTGIRPDGQPVEGSYLASYLPEHAYGDGFEENVAFFKMEYLEPDLVELGRQYEAIAPLLWMAAGSIGEWEPWDGGSAWSVPTSSTYAVLFDEARAADFVGYVASRAATATDSSPSISHVWIVTDSHSAFVELRASLPDDVVVGQLYRDYMRNFAINGPKADG